MPLPEINRCPGTLAPGYTTYSKTALMRMFNGLKVSHLLPAVFPERKALQSEIFRENVRRVSLSGVQPKVSVDLADGLINLSPGGNSGNYILKPAPFDLPFAECIPANEHLTMQIARQVYGIMTAENALVFFQSGEAAYLTKRFDKAGDGLKFPLEDFASLAGKSPETAGADFKYDGSYEDIAVLIKSFIPAAKIETEKFFKLILFNFLSNNGDAHLKNFSVIHYPQSGYQLAPAYDLINTRLHVSDPELALLDGLFKDDFETKSFEANGFRAYDDFYMFGLRIGILEPRVKRMLDFFRADHAKVRDLIEASYLSDELKKLYSALWSNRLKSLNYSFSKLI